VEQGLTLVLAAADLAALKTHVPLHGPPSLDLAGIFDRQASALVVAAVPLKPAARVSRMYPPFFRQTERGWLAATPK
jgi:hypothetical protein